MCIKIDDNGVFHDFKLCFVTGVDKKLQDLFIITAN